MKTELSLREIKSDLPASIVVFFVALPLCLGIALASGAPLFSGIIAGIVGGVIVGAASGSRLGVSGPAAGLAVIVFDAITTLGTWEIFLCAVVLAGITVMGVAYLTASLADQLWQYYTLMFLAGFFGAGGIFAPIMSLVGRWFPIGAGLAIGLASAGQALGQGGVPFASAFLIDAFGVDQAFAITGGLMLVVLLPLAILLKPARAADGAGAGTADQGYPPFRLVVSVLCVAIFLCCTCMSVPLMHLIPHIQGRGFSADQAGGVVFLMLMVGVLGRVAFGKLSDMIGAIPAYMTATAWMSLLIYGFILIHDLSSFYVYAPIYGFGYAGVMTGVLATTAAYTPPNRRAFAMAIVTMFGWFGHANGGYLGGFLYDLTADYAAAYAVAALAGALNLVVVGTFYWKIRKPGAGQLVGV